MDSRINLYKIKLIFLSLFLSIFISSYTLKDINVLSVHDGDTISVSINGTKKNIRLIGIDAPELAQPLGKDSAKMLSNLLLGKKVTIETDKKELDLYGRILGYVYVDNILINEAMLKNGGAYYYYVVPNKKYYLKLIQAENIAKGLHIGVWSVTDISPKEFRKLHKIK